MKVATSGRMETKTHDDKKQLLEMVRDFSQAMLVTHSLEGDVRARPMSVAAVEDSGDFWFATALDSGKADEMLRERRVAVVMQSDKRFVSISGDAALIMGAAKAKELWTEAWRPWFPDGPEDTTLALIQVRARTAEYWDMRGTKGLRYVFEAVKHVVMGEPMVDASSPDQHGKLELR